MIKIYIHNLTYTLSKQARFCIALCVCVGLLPLCADEPNILPKASNTQLDEQIQYYKELLKENDIEPIKLYPDSDYIEYRFKDAPAAKKKNLSKYYTIADKKTGAFSSIMLGFGTIRNSYEDGKYNTANNVTSNLDDSAIATSGVLQSPLNIDSTLFSFGGGFGYQNFFNPYFGSRLYGDGLFSTGSEKINGEKVGTFYYILGGMNADLLFDVPLALFSKNRFLRNINVGAYFGVNIGVMLLFDQSNDKLRNYTFNGIYLQTDTKRYTHSDFESQNVLWRYQLQVDYGVNFGFSITIAERNKIEFGAKIPMSVFGLPSELRLGLEKPATYTGTLTTETIKNPPSNYEGPISEEKSETLVSKDITFTRSPIYLISFIRLF